MDKNDSSPTRAKPLPTPEEMSLISAKVRSSVELCCDLTCKAGATCPRIHALEVLKYLNELAERERNPTHYMAEG